MPRLSPAAFVLVALAALVGCRRLAQHPLVIEAAEEVRANARVADALGAPVTCSTAVRGTANELDGIASLQFDASGPKGTGVVVVEGKKTRDEWGVTLLELRPGGAGERRIPLTADLEARTGTDTPKFDPAATAAPTTAAPPPADIEIVLPPGPPGQ
ncbi:MAG: cytochrome c oxidase assembly factor Coa1 family protein [Pirellulales bacterium]